MRLSGVTIEETRLRDVTPCPASLGEVFAAAKTSSTSSTSRRAFENDPASPARATTTSRGSVHARRASSASRQSWYAGRAGGARFLTGMVEVSPGRARLAFPGIASAFERSGGGGHLSGGAEKRGPRTRGWLRTSEGARGLEGATLERHHRRRARLGAGRPRARLCEPARTRETRTRGSSPERRNVSWTRGSSQCFVHETRWRHRRCSRLSPAWRSRPAAPRAPPAHPVGSASPRSGARPTTRSRDASSRLSPRRRT